MKTQQKGFTLIELIIVIVVLGILAVTAAPQFFNFSSDARESTVKGMEGSVKAAVQMVYGKALIEGVENIADTATTRPVVTTSDGVTVFTNYGYPAADGMAFALDIDSTDWTTELLDGTVAATLGATATDAAAAQFVIYPADVASPIAATDPGTCYVIYQEATTSAKAVVSSVITGC